MLLNKLRLENFRIHRTFELKDIPRLLILWGLGASGKTSVVEALTWLFSGATRHTTQDGKGADCLIMDGETDALVEANLKNGTEDVVIKRGIPNKLTVNGSGGNVKRTTELLKTVMAPMDPGKFLLCFETHRILHMSDKERRRLLSMVVGVSDSTPKETIREHLSTWMPTVGIAAGTSVFTRVLERYDADAPAGNLAYDYLYKLFYASRRDLNGKISNLQSVVPTPPAGELLPEPAKTLERLYERKALLDVELKISKNLQPTEEKPVKAIIKKPDVTVLQSRIDNLRSVLDRCSKEATQKAEKIALAESQGAQVTGAAKQCPIFARECPLSKEDIQEAIDRISESMETDKKDLTQCNRRVTVTQKALTEAETALAEAQKELQDYNQIWSKMTSHEFDRVRDEKLILEDMAKLQEAINNAMEHLKYQEALLVAQESKTALEAAEASAPVLETLVTAFSPSGIQGMLLTAHLPRLEQLATQASQTITRGRYEITFSIVDGELDVSVISQQKKRPITTLSTSEEIWVSLVIQHVVNTLLGNRYLMIDEASTLDVSMQEGLQDFLVGIMTANECQYDNVIICATTENQQFLPRLEALTPMRVRLE